MSFFQNIELQNPKKAALDSKPAAQAAFFHIFIIQHHAPPGPVPAARKICHAFIFTLYEMPPFQYNRTEI